MSTGKWGQAIWGGVGAVLLLFWPGNWAAGNPEREIAGLLSDRDFFGEIDLEFPGLEKVNRAVGAGDWAKAKSELADYYRNRKGRFFPFDPENPAEGFSARRLRLAGEALVNRTGEFGPEMWTEEGHFRWSGARMRMKERTYFFESFGRAAALEKEGKVAAALMGLARDFAAEYQSGPERRGSMWSAMNVGIRMRSGWPVAFLALADSEAISDEDLVLYLKSVWDQTTHLRKNASETSNWLTFEMAGLYTSGILYPEFKDAEEWRRFACETAIRDLERGWLPDGMTVELTPGYGKYFTNYFRIYRLAEFSGRLDEFGMRDYPRRTERLFEAFLRAMAPDRLAPATNDNGPADVREILEEALEYFPEREDFRWVATDGKEGRAPEFESTVFPYAGFAAMRSGWEREANFGYFDFGPVGYRHAHQDKLNLTIWAYGRQVLFDPGLMDYDEKNPLVNYARDSFSHNTVAVDGRPQRRAWYQAPHPRNMPYRKLEDFRWESGENFDFAAGVYEEAYGKPGVSNSYPYAEGSDFREGWGQPATHYRRVYFHKPDLFLVADTLVSKDGKSHKYDVRWHLDSVEISTRSEGRIVATADAGKPNLEVVPLFHEGVKVTLASGQMEPEISGWNAGNPSARKPATTVRHLKSGAGTVRFLTLLLPLKEGEASRLRSVRPVDETTVEIGLADGRRLTVHVPEDPWKKLEVEEGR